MFRKVTEAPQQMGDREVGPPWRLRSGWKTHSDYGSLLELL